MPSGGRWRGTGWIARPRNGVRRRWLTWRLLWLLRWLRWPRLSPSCRRLRSRSTTSTPTPSGARSATDRYLGTCPKTASPAGRRDHHDLKDEEEGLLRALLPRPPPRLPPEPSAVTRTTT